MLTFIPMDATARLLHIPEIRKQPANRKTYALHLINRGADAALLLFWINLVTGAYSHFPMASVKVDAIHYLELYPDFAGDIIQWFATFERLMTTSKTFPCNLSRTPLLTPSVPSPG